MSGETASSEVGEQSPPQPQALQQQQQQRKQQQQQQRDGKKKRRSSDYLTEYACEGSRLQINCTSSTGEPGRNPDEIIFL